MDIDDLIKVRAVIADELVGCSFQNESTQDTLNRVEEIMVALKEKGYIIAPVLCAVGRDENKAC